jgi:hypothetical protein
LAGIKRRRKPADHLTVDMALCGGGLIIKDTS